MATSIHLTNAKGRNATVALAGVKPIPPPKLGLPGATLVFRKYIAAAETGTHAALQEKFGQDYAQQLITGDPEVDLEVIGSTVEDTQTVYLDGEGKVMLRLFIRDCPRFGDSPGGYVIRFGRKGDWAINFPKQWPSLSRVSRRSNSGQELSTHAFAQ